MNIEDNKEWDNMRVRVDPRVARQTAQTMDEVRRGVVTKKPDEGQTKAAQVRLLNPKPQTLNPRA